MSDIGDIITALKADLTAAISGITNYAEPIAVDAIPSENFPCAIVVQTEYGVDNLDWGQEQRTWTVSTLLVQERDSDNSLETEIGLMDAKLEAVRDQMNADRTLGGTAERATFAGAVPLVHEDEKFVYGVFVVEAEKVA